MMLVHPNLEPSRGHVGRVECFPNGSMSLQGDGDVSLFAVEHVPIYQNTNGCGRQILGIRLDIDQVGIWLLDSTGHDPNSLYLAMNTGAHSVAEKSLPVYGCRCH